MSALILGSMGWSVCAAAAPTPVEEVARFIRDSKPDLLCLSLVTAPLPAAFSGGYGEIWESSRRAGTRVALGGRGASEAGDLPCDFRGGSLRELETYARGLGGRRGGARRRTHARS
jgi:hypothetical protein